jgi:hypothetical protein
MPGVYGLNLSGSRYGSVSGFCEQGTEPSCSISQVIS